MTLYTKHSIFLKLEHRGAVSADGRTGDGAGIYLISLMIFLKKYVILNSKTKEYAVGMVFLPKETTKSFFLKTL
jgi:glutamate synthase (ferredoxin)